MTDSFRNFRRKFVRDNDFAVLLKPVTYSMGKVVDIHDGHGRNVDEDTQICTPPNHTDAKAIGHAPMRYDERIKKNTGATAMGRGIPSIGADRSAKARPFI
jgi:hypothetical protein